MSSNDYGQFFKHHRILSGYKSQRRFAEATKISPATISRIEDGKHRPAPETIQAFSKLLHTTSIVEMMVACGYWDEEELLQPLDMEVHQEGHQILKENSPSYANEKEFIEKIDLSDDDLLKQFKLAVDGRELSEQETKNMIAFVRTLRKND